MIRKLKYLARLRWDLVASLGWGLAVSTVLLIGGAIFVMSRPTLWSARESALVLPERNIALGDLAAYYETLSRGQVVATFAEILRRQHFEASAADQAGISARDRRRLQSTIQVVANTAVIEVAVTAPSGDVAGRVASGIVTEARGYLSNLEMPFRLVVLTPEEDVSKRSGPTKAPLAGVILLVAVSAGIATQQAAWQLAKLPPVEARPTTSPRIPHSPESDGHGGIHAPTSEELTR